MDNKNKITSFESDEKGAFGDVLSSRPEKKLLKVGLLGLGYFEYWRMYPELKNTVARDLDGLKSRLVKHSKGCKIVYPGMVDTLDRAEEAGNVFRNENVDIIIIAAGTYLPDFITIHALNKAGNDVPVILFNTQTGNDVSPNDDYVATMRNSALIAVSQLSGSFQKMKKTYDVVVGEIRDPRPYTEINGIIKARLAVKELKLCTFGLIGHVFRGMYDLEFDAAKVKGFLGPEVMAIQAEQLIDIWKDIEPSRTKRLARELSSRFRMRKVGSEDLERSCRLAVAMRKLYNRFKLDGMCFLGQHYIEKMTGAPARIGASMMLEKDRNMVACEGDIAGLAMMKLMERFTGNIPFQAEWGQFDKKNNALFLLGHGIASPCLAASDESVTLTRAPEEWGFDGKGLNYEMIMKPGKVTMAHLLNKGESWRMLISEGESIKFPCLPCDEIHGMIKVKSPVEEYIKEVLRHGVAHHIIVVHGSVADELSRTADLMNIQKVFVK
jgi:L-arabinose isomerase